MEPSLLIGYGLNGPLSWVKVTKIKLSIRNWKGVRTFLTAN